MTKQSRILGLVVFCAAVSLVPACGGDTEDEALSPTEITDNETSDPGQSNDGSSPDNQSGDHRGNDEADMGTAGGDEDTSGASEDDGGSTENPAPDAGGADMGNVPCDAERIEEMVAEFVGTRTTIAEGTIEVTEEEGARVAVIDASLGGRPNAPSSSYMYIDLDEGTQLQISDVDALENAEWDIALHRTNIRLNGADSGPGNLLLTKLEETTWEAAEVPGRMADWTEDDFVTEECEAQTFGRGSLMTAFGLWYDYNPKGHIVSAPEKVIYFIYNAQTHAVTKLQIEDHDSSEGAAIYTIRWAPATVSRE